MSERHGDKARFGKQRHAKMLRGKRHRALLKALSLGNKTRIFQANPQ